MSFTVRTHCRLLLASLLGYQRNGYEDAWYCQAVRLAKG